VQKKGKIKTLAFHLRSANFPQDDNFSCHKKYEENLFPFLPFYYFFFREKIRKISKVFLSVLSLFFWGFDGKT
jgi:hypothetical protein